MYSRMITPITRKITRMTLLMGSGIGRRLIRYQNNQKTRPEHQQVDEQSQEAFNHWGPFSLEHLPIGTMMEVSGWNNFW